MTTKRRVLLLAHTGRAEARAVATTFVQGLTHAGMVVRLVASEAHDLGLHGVDSDPSFEITESLTDASRDCELTLVIGGDGSILRAVELTYDSGTPVLGVNLGHVGFLAEAEPEEVESTITAIVEGAYTVEDRMTLDVEVSRDGEVVARTFAVNEASVEKAARERMLEVVVEVDGRPLSRWGCDGVVCATPTGSTAYNFSAGGPIVWPEVEALCLVPLSAHALFARPMVVAPSSRIAIDVLPRTEGGGVLWCDGRRTVDLPPGARIVVRRGVRPVRLARLHEAPFTDRLVAKFGLNVEGWRGEGERRRLRGVVDHVVDPVPAPVPRHRPGARPRRPGDPVIEEIRITSLGVIDASVLDLGPGLTVITGETGAGKTMVVTALGLLLGGRADSGAVRTGAKQARVEGVVRAEGLPNFAAAVEDAGGEVEDGLVVLARNVSAEGRSRAFVGGATVPVARLTEVAEPLVAVHGQSDQHRLLLPRAQREALDRFGGAPLARLLADYTATYDALDATRRELELVTASARERAREADLLRFGLGEVEAVSPEPGEDESLAAEESRLGFADTLRTAAEQAREALSSESGSPDALGTTSAARGFLEGVREHDPEAAELADRLAEVTYLVSDVAADVASYAARLDTDPARLATVSERRAALTALTRKYGDTVDEVLAWSAQAATRLLDLDGTDERIAALTVERDRLAERLTAAAAALSKARTKAAKKLEREVTAELTLLAMPHARLAITVTPIEPAAHGADDVALLLAANTGAEPRALSKGASGGELSRVMLAVEVALAAAGTHKVPTFVFDEVDAGVGGAAAVEVGRRLAMLARSAQVLVVTHLPQVAAYADRHVLVRKSDDGSVTSSGLTVLDDEARERELSRMLAGLEDSDTALAHARELLEVAQTARSARAEG